MRKLGTFGDYTDKNDTSVIWDIQKRLELLDEFLIPNSDGLEQVALLAEYDSLREVYNNIAGFEAYDLRYTPDVS